MSRHYNITIQGKVQGVFFRASAKQMADALGVKGLVKNEPNGDVFIEAEGSENSMTKFIQWCHHGPVNAGVEHVSIKNGEMQSFEKFEIIR